MSKRRISTGQVRSLIAAFVNSIPEDLDFSLAQEWVRKIPLVAPALLSGSPEEFLRYPALNEKFTLFIDGHSRYFKLVNVGWKLFADELRTALGKKGRLAGEDVRPFFLRAYPQSDSVSPIGFDPYSWKPAQGEEVKFRGINHGKLFDFWWVSNSGTIGEWRWCVEVNAND